MPTITYRLSRFGTVLLTPEQQLSTYLLLRISCVFRRALEYPNPRFIPPQNNWLYWVGIDRDGYVSYDGYARWYRQQWLLWEYRESSVLNAVCQTSNDIYLEIMRELAKKPNIPPLAPTVPPLNPPFSTIGRLQSPSVNALTFAAFNDGDFDVTLDWQDPPPVGPCSPSPSLPPPPGPVNPSLPPPAPNMASPPPLSALVPPSGPPGSPAQGASLIPPGFPTGYQSAPPSTPQFKRVTVTWVGVNSCNLPCDRRATIDEYFYVPFGDGTEDFAVEIGTATVVCGAKGGFVLRRRVNGVFSQVGSIPSFIGVFSATLGPIINYNGPQSPSSVVVVNPCQ